MVIVITTCECQVEKKLTPKQTEKVNQIFSEVGDICAAEKVAKKK